MDLKIALRSLRHSPGFTILSVLILALGIGANTAIFSVVHGVILRPLAYPDPARLVSISTSWQGGGSFGQVSGPDFVDFQTQSTAFTSMAAYDEQAITVVANQTSELAGAAEIGPEFLPTIGVSPIAGRALSPRDFLGKPAVALLSAGFWQRHFGDVPFTPGHTVRGAFGEVEIVGLLPAGFHFPEASTAELWVPFSEAPQGTNRGAHNYRVIARLKSGVSLRESQAQLTIIAARLARQYPETNQRAGVLVTALNNFTVRNVRTNLYLLLAAVALVLFIACANIASLLLARGTGRVRELAIRAALGATRARLVRQLFVETLVLAASGCALGVLVAAGVLPVLLSFAPKYVPHLEQVRIDPAALAFCLAAGLLSSLLFGLTPALQAREVDPNRDLRGAGARGVLGGRSVSLRQLFVTAQIALSVVLLVSAGLLVKSFMALTAVDLGFRPQQLLVAKLSVASDTAERASQTVFMPLLSRLASNSNLQPALIQNLPSDSDFRPDGDYIITGQTMKDFTVSAPQAGFSVVSGSFFSTAGIPLIEGRTFSAGDTPDRALVATVSRGLALRSFGRHGAVGEKILCGADLVSMKWMTIVGVVGDVRMDSARDRPMPEIYMPFSQHPRQDMYLVARAGRDPLASAPLVRSVVRSLDPTAFVKFTTMENHLSDAVSTPRFSGTLLSVFAGLALLLASIGIYGVMAFTVSQRTSEIGLRMALGADRALVLRSVLGQALRLTAAGLLAGSLAAYAAARLLASQLFGVAGSDPATYGATLLLLAAVSLAAAFLPAWRASRIEPLAALRQE